MQPYQALKSLCFYLLIIGLLTQCTSSSDTIAQSSTDYQPLIQQLTQLIESEMEQKEIPAISIALVDGQNTVWSEGFGFEDKEKTRPASASTIYRVGSVSKLFTDMAIMQLVEQGLLNLDTSVTSYLPDFKPKNPFKTPITLRQLMAHRSGLVREPPIGNYFDAQNDRLTPTIESLNQTELVYAPGTRIKYSNAGIAVVGKVLEKMNQLPFSQCLDSFLVNQIGMSRTSFSKPIENTAVPYAQMWGYDHRKFKAPTFELGMAPAGSMYSTVEDLALFIKLLFNNGTNFNGQMLTKETIQQMWTPQFSEPNTKVGYGIGFNLSNLNGHQQIGHGGAIYGFSTQLSFLPDQEVGIIITCAIDGANAFLNRIVEYALTNMLHLKNEQSLDPFPTKSVIPPPIAKKLDGTYQFKDQKIRFHEDKGRLYLWWNNRKIAVNQFTEDTLITDDLLDFGTKIDISQDQQITIKGKTYTKSITNKPNPIPSKWAELIGEYGEDFNVLFITEQDEQLHALIEWFFWYPLKEVAPNTFEFPNYGLYHGEKIQFEQNNNGQIVGAKAAGIFFKKRKALEPGKTFKIIPIRPIAEIKENAFAATPPEEANKKEPELVEIAEMDPTILLDIRYASTNNFMGAQFYDEPRAFLQKPAAEALVKVHQKLKKRGLGLLVFDAYRPWYVTKMFYDATPGHQKIFVANPKRGSSHNRGSAVDLTLYDLKTKQPVQMVSGFDEFSERAYAEYPGTSSLQRYYRELLRDVMEEAGFNVYSKEWWHFNYRGSSQYPILNLKFSDL